MSLRKKSLGHGVLWFQLAEASTRDRVGPQYVMLLLSLINLCVDGRKDLESGINIYSCHLFLLTFLSTCIYQHAIGLSLLVL